MFAQSCLPYAGNPPALRQWAGRLHLPLAPEPARAAFLHGAPGQVFDASNIAGKFVLVSSDDGICSVVTDHAGDAETVHALEHVLTAAGLNYRLVAERNDKINPKLHQREYLAANAKRRWRILAATVRGGAPDQAMLTAGAE